MGFWELVWSYASGPLPRPSLPDFPKKARTQKIDYQLLLSYPITSLPSMAARLPSLHFREVKTRWRKPMPADPEPLPDTINPVADFLFQAALERIDQANALDPNTINIDGQTLPHELFYSRRLTEWVRQLNPSASQPLLLAARAQHICRWQTPRASYPEGRAGYLKWRADLKQFHAATSARILADLGFPPAFIARVQSLNLKKGLGHDPEVQTLEDALCLMTLQYQLTDLCRKTEHQKMIAILQKTWRKMSEAARAAALALPYAPDQFALIQEALS